MNENEKAHAMVTIGRPPGAWPGMAASPAGPDAAYCAAGCGGQPVVLLGGYGFCRAHWPAFRAWWLDAPAGDSPSPDLHEVYDREAARAYLNVRLVEAGRRPLSEGAFLKRLYERYPLTFALEPLRFGERTGGVAEGAYARQMAFTRRMLDEVAARPARAAHEEPVRPSAAERQALLATPEAVAYLNAIWAAARVNYTMTRRQLMYYRQTGRVPGVRVGASDVYLREDLDRLAAAVAATGGWSVYKSGPRRGPRIGA